MKMPDIKKCAAAALSLLMLMTAAGCKKDDDSNPDSAETDAGTKVINTAADYEFKPNDVLMTIDGTEVTYDKYRYYFLSLKSSFDGGDESFWNGAATTEGTAADGSTVAAKSAEEVAKERLGYITSYVENYLKSDATLYKMVEQNGVAFTAEDEAEVRATVEEYKTMTGSDEKWQEYLDSTYCTEDVLYEMLKGSYLEQKLVKELYGDRFKEKELKDYVHVQHILLLTNDATYEKKEIPEGATDEEKAAIEAENAAALEKATEDLKASQHELAEQILERARDGEDFEALIKEYNQDPGMAADADGHYPGYHFTYNEMVEAFEKTSFAMEEGEISDIVETPYGYHIIKKLPIDMDYIDANLMNYLSKSAYVTEYSEMGDEIYKSLEITPTDLYQYISIANIK